MARRELGPHNQHRFLHRSLGVFVLLYSLYLYFCILCNRTFGFFVSAFLLHLFGFQTLESHCCTRPLIRKLSWHITLQEQRRPWLTFFRMHFYSFRLNFSSIFYFCCSCSLQCNIITRQQLTRKPQIRDIIWDIILELTTYFAKKVCVVVSKRGLCIEMLLVNQQFM